MSFNEQKITDDEIAAVGVQSQPDKLTGTAAQNKGAFDALVKLLVKIKFNNLIDELLGGNAAAQIGVDTITGLDAATVQEALEAIMQNIQGITQGAVADGSITTVKLSDAAVTEAKLDDGAVTEGKLGAGAVTAAKLAGGAVTTDKITSGAVTEGKLADGAVTEGKIAAGAVTAGKIASAAVDNTKLAADAVTGVKLADGAVTSQKIADGAVTTGKMVNGSVTAEKLASGAVNAAKLGSAAVTADKLADGSVTKDKLSFGAVTFDKMAGIHAYSIGAAGDNGTISFVLGENARGVFITVGYDSRAIYMLRRKGDTVNADYTSREKFTHSYDQANHIVTLTHSGAAPAMGILFVLSGSIELPEEVIEIPGEELGG